MAHMGEERVAYRVLVGKSEGKRPLGRPRRRWVDNIRMDLQEVGCGYVDWINIYLVAFTAAVFNKIVLDDSCTWWWSSKPLRNGTGFHH